MTVATVARDPMRVVSRSEFFSGVDLFMLDLDVTRDGKRVLAAQLEPGGTGLVVIPNFASELKAKTQ